MKVSFMTDPEIIDVSYSRFVEHKLVELDGG